jgi:hypothetical protein
MQEQVSKLYHGLVTASIAARGNKADLRMLLDVEGLQSYLTYAFTHFSGTLEFPFDFVQASFINSPIPANFGGNILKLAINIMDIWQRNTKPSIIFEAIGYMVASCIMFESARNNIPGESRHRSLISKYSLTPSNTRQGGTDISQIPGAY